MATMRDCHLRVAFSKTGRYTNGSRDILPFVPVGIGICEGCDGGKSDFRPGVAQRHPAC
jgi:hypothetical protein